MTKADLLKILDRMPMNTPIELEIGAFPTVPTRAFACVGLHGLVLVLTDGPVPPVECEPEEVLF